MRKKILLVLDREMETLPPFMTMIDVLLEKYNVSVLCVQKDNVNLERYRRKGVHFVGEIRIPRVSNRYIRFAWRKFILRILFYRIASKALRDRYDLIWIASAQTAVALSSLLKGKEYFLTVYELHDRFPRFLKKLAPAVRGAKKVFVCEENRAHIYRAWFGLKETPYVIPNKPLELPGRECDFVQAGKIRSAFLRKSGERVLLYQGHITRDRDIDALCEAIKLLKNWILVLMGAKTPYLRELKQKYDFLRHVDFIPPPDHLRVTSLADVGVVTYAHYSLNTIFCAPNKIWEYAGCGLPMLANGIPGLTQSVGKYGVAVCVDMTNPQEIARALGELDENYNAYRARAHTFWESVDVGSLISQIVEAHLTSF